MIEFNFDKIDWSKYEYPGFEEGDIIKEIVTCFKTQCLGVASAKELDLCDEDIPEYYKFISIADQFGNGRIWVNPELYELVQKRKGLTKKPSTHYLRWLEVNEANIIQPPEPAIAQGIRVVQNWANAPQEADRDIVNENVQDAPGVQANQVDQLPIVRIERAPFPYVILPHLAGEERRKGNIIYRRDSDGIFLARAMGGRREERQEGNNVFVMENGEEVAITPNGIRHLRADGNGIWQLEIDELQNRAETGLAYWKPRYESLAQLNRIRRENGMKPLNFEHVEVDEFVV